MINEIILAFTRSLPKYFGGTIKTIKNQLILVENRRVLLIILNKNVGERYET